MMKHEALTMAQTKFGEDSRALAEKANQAIGLCAEDAGHCKTLLKDFLKDNKERFAEEDVELLLDLLDSLDLMESRLKDANEDLSDVLFGSDD